MSIVEQPTLAQRCARIEMLVLDVDGVLTDGSIVYGDNDVEMKAFHVRDGSGLKLWHLAGKRSAVITGRTSKVVVVRAAELGVAAVVQGATDKLPAFEQLAQSHGLTAEQLAYLGDDVPDLPILRRCGLALAVADACAEVIADAHYVTRVPGGRGAARDAIELILKAQNLWANLLERFRS
jgi:3-deoxy-D-manno-octulosonate 8-phosphate phosphatase (KDO 8-P phosphatase)